MLFFSGLADYLGFKNIQWDAYTLHIIHFWTQGVSPSSLSSFGSAGIVTASTLEKVRGKIEAHVYVQKFNQLALIGK